MDGELYMFKSIKRQRISDEIADQVKTLISQGKLNPGDRLPPERDLIKEFGVSRPSLREALNSLVSQGFLEVKQGNRTFVKSITAEKLQDPLSVLIKADTQKIFDLIEVRKAMESWGAYHAAQRVREEDIRRLEEIIGEMKEALDQGTSWEKQDADFHLAMAQATHNTIQTHMMFMIYDLLRESVARVFRDQRKMKKLFQQHYQIFNAIKNRSPDKAREKVLEHLNYVESEVKSFRNQEKSS